MLVYSSSSAHVWQWLRIAKLITKKVHICEVSNMATHEANKHHPLKTHVALGAEKTYNFWIRFLDLKADTRFFVRLTSVNSSTEPLNIFQHLSAIASSPVSLSLKRPLMTA